MFKTDTIAIASEELFLSKDEVRVAYVYHSKAPVTQNVTISFPMPEVETDDSPLAEFLFGAQEKGDLRNYMKFAVTVDGKPVAARLREAARLYGKDVTARLRGAGIPSIFLAKGQEAMKRAPKHLRDALIAEGLFDKPQDPEPRFYSARWKYQVLYQWEQSFPPGPTRVDIRYRPITGDGQDFGDFYSGPKRRNAIASTTPSATRSNAAARRASSATASSSGTL